MAEVKDNPSVKRRRLKKRDDTREPVYDPTVPEHRFAAIEQRLARVEYDMEQMHGEFDEFIDWYNDLREEVDSNTRDVPTHVLEKIELGLEAIQNIEDRLDALESE